MQVSGKLPGVERSRASFPRSTIRMMIKLLQATLMTEEVEVIIVFLFLVISNKKSKYLKQKQKNTEVDMKASASLRLKQCATPFTN